MIKTVCRSVGRTLVTGLLITAFTVTVWAQQLTINIKQGTLEQFLKQVSAQTGYKFTYTDAINAKGKTVTVNVTNADPITFFNTFFKENGIDYKINNKQVYLSPAKKSDSQLNSKQSQDTQKTLKGKVTDETGEPLVGVYVKNEKNAALSTTDADGNYTIKAEEGDKLVFTYVGMETYTATAGKSAVVNVAMKTDAIALENVVITGYQTISKERSAASYSVIKGENVKSSAMSRGSILESLEGTASGFTVNTSANTTNKYLVRGITSINSNQEPLFVLDGVAVSTDDVEKLLSANDIASVTVLKDATAVSIWGSRAANGVIVITSKAGNNTNGRINVSYDGNFTYKGKPSLKSYNLMDSKTFIKNALEVFESADYQEAYPWETITNMTKGLTKITYDTPVVLPHEQILYDWKRGIISLDERDNRLNDLANRDAYSQYQEVMMTNMWKTSHNISLSGGTDRFKIFGSLGYDGNQGNYHNKDNTYKLNLKQEYSITKWLDWDLSLNVSHSESREHTDFLQKVGSGSWLDPYTGMLPYAMLKNDNGNWTDFNDYYMLEKDKEKIKQNLDISPVYHPVEDFYNNFKKKKDTRFRANTALKIKIWRDIEYEVRLQYLRGVSNYEYFISPETWSVRHDRIRATTSTLDQLLPKDGGDYELTDNLVSDWTVRNQVAYNGSFNGKEHQITALLGTEYRENKTNINTSFERGYDYQTMTNTSYDITAAKSSFRNYFGKYPSVSTDNTTQSETVLRYVSYYGNLAYTFKNRYSINGSARIDQSNLFGTDVNSQYKPIGSIGISWRIKEEKFLKNIDWINSLTARLSWGHSGNSPLPTMGGPYDIIGVNVGGRYFNNQNGYIITSPSNKKIRWETTRTWNLGVDFSFLDYRINGSVDLYHKKTSDMLATKLLNILTGYESIYANVGALENKGIELSLNTVNVQTNEFTWSSNLNISYNKNKVLDYYKVPATTLYSKIYNGKYSEGYPAGALWGLKWAGLRHEDGVPQVYNKDGDIIYKYTDLKADDAYYIGTMIPKCSGSFSNTLSYKGFDLTAMIIFNLGHKMYTYDTPTLRYRFNYNRDNEFDKRWRQPGDETKTIIPSSYEDANNKGRALYYSENIFAYSDVMVQSASYAKLRELTLSYNLPKHVCEKLKMQNIKVRITGHDIFKIVANNKGIDPEVGIKGKNYGTYYSIGLSVNF